MRQDQPIQMSMTESHTNEQFNGTPSLSYAHLFSFQVSFRSLNSDNINWSAESNDSDIGKMAVVKNAAANMYTAASTFASGFLAKMKKVGQWRRGILQVNFAAGSFNLLDKDRVAVRQEFHSLRSVEGTEDGVTSTHITAILFEEDEWKIITQNDAEIATLQHLIESIMDGQSVEETINAGKRKGLIGLEKRIIKDGVVNRKAKTAYKYDQRFVILVPGKLFVFKTPNIAREHVRYVTTLHGAMVTVPYGQSWEFQILVPKTKDLTFIASTESAMSDWVQATRSCIEMLDQLPIGAEPNTTYAQKSKDHDTCSDRRDDTSTSNRQDVHTGTHEVSCQEVSNNRDVTRNFVKDEMPYKQGITQAMGYEQNKEEGREQGQYIARNILCPERNRHESIHDHSQSSRQAVVYPEGNNGRRGQGQYNARDNMYHERECHPSVPDHSQRSRQAMGYQQDFEAGSRGREEGQYIAKDNMHQERKMNQNEHDHSHISRQYMGYQQDNDARREQEEQRQCSGGDGLHKKTNGYQSINDHTQNSGYQARSETRREKNHTDRDNELNQENRINFENLSIYPSRIQNSRYQGRPSQLAQQAKDEANFKNDIVDQGIVNSNYEGRDLDYYQSKHNAGSYQKDSHGGHHTPALQPREYTGRHSESYQSRDTNAQYGKRNNGIYHPRDAGDERYTEESGDYTGSHVQLHQNREKIAYGKGNIDADQQGRPAQQEGDFTSSRDAYIDSGDYPESGMIRGRLGKYKGNDNNGYEQRVYQRSNEYNTEMPRNTYKKDHMEGNKYQTRSGHVRHHSQYGDYEEGNAGHEGRVDDATHAIRGRGCKNTIKSDRDEWEDRDHRKEEPKFRRCEDRDHGKEKRKVDSNTEEFGRGVSRYSDEEYKSERGRRVGFGNRS